MRIIISNQTGTTSSFSYDTPFLASISTIRPTSGGVTVTCPPCSLLTHTHCLTLSWSSLRLQLWCSLSPVVRHHRVFILRLTLPHHPTPCIRLHYARPLRLSRVCSPCFSAVRHSQRCLLPFIPPQQHFSLVFLHRAAHGFDPFFVVADNASGITFSYDFPFLSSFSSPRSLEGGTVTVTGSNFGAKSLPSSVTIGSSACDHQAKVTGHTAFFCIFKRFSSNTSSSQGLYVNVSFGSIVISSTFNYDIPAVTGLSPNRSTSGGTITISGTDFGKFYPPPQPELNPHALLPLQARPPTPGPSQSACRHAVQ